ncbi:MAG: hypothetical protein ABIH26_00225 [Candidatus Eisenbacteria bacterium]
MSAPRFPPWPAWCSAALLSIAVAFAGGEIYLRSARPVTFRAPVSPENALMTGCLLHRPSETPGLLYELAPGAEGGWLGAEIRTNSHGMRGEEIDPRRPASVVRIATVGDSFTFGFGVSNDRSSVSSRFSPPTIRGRSRLSTDTSR